MNPIATPMTIITIIANTPTFTQSFGDLGGLTRTMLNMNNIPPAPITRGVATANKKFPVNAVGEQVPSLHLYVSPQ